MWAYIIEVFFALESILGRTWDRHEYCQKLQKPDGRQLTLYSRYPIAEDIKATSPSNEPIQANLHLRWHSLRGKWVAYASYRQGQTLALPERLPCIHKLSVIRFHI
jgi:hypothetical protein